MAAFDPQAYGPVFAPLLNTDRRRPLDAGRPDVSALGALKKLSAEAAFAHLRSEFNKTPPVDTDMTACCVAGVWLLHDYLDESHTISQGIDTTSGSFWHAIMHRREGDFSNAKYWFRHVGEHPTFAAIGQRAHVAASLRDADPKFGETCPPDRNWDPFAFVDLCQAAVRGNSDVREFCSDLQQAEWEALFHYCFHAATREQ